MGALFADKTNRYTWLEDTLNLGMVWSQAQLKLEHWSSLFNATGVHSNRKNASGIFSIMNVWTENGSMWT